MIELTRHLQAAGTDLIDPPGGSRFHLPPLRKLKDNILPTYHSSAFKGEVRSLSFLLTVLLDDVFYNLVGDFPYDKRYGESVDKSREEFFRTVGTVFLELSKMIADDDFSTLYARIQYLVIKYIEAIGSINSEIDKSMAQ